MIKKIKLLLNITDDSKDDLLDLLIEQATIEALDYTHTNNASKLASSIIDIVVYKYNRLGSEGVNSENYSGISFDYSADYPESIMRGLRAKRQMIVL